MNKENVFKQSTKQGKLDRLAYYMWKMRSPNYSDYTNSLVKAKQMVEEINFYGFMVGLVSRELTGIPTNVHELEEITDELFMNIFNERPIRQFHTDSRMDTGIKKLFKKAKKSFLEALPDKKHLAEKVFDTSVYNNNLGALLSAALKEDTTPRERVMMFEFYFAIMKPLTEIAYKKIEEKYLNNK